MPFIRGRYHINAVMGQALEAARQAEGALAENRRSRDGDPDDGLANHSSVGDQSDQADGFRSGQDAAGKGPVHRIEIEAAALVPQSSGRAARGFVVRVHHASSAPDTTPGVASDAATGASPNVSMSGAGKWRGGNPAVGAAPETHVFAGHGDMVDFLRDALDADSRGDH